MWVERGAGGRALKTELGCAMGVRRKTVGQKLDDLGNWDVLYDFFYSVRQLGLCQESNIAYIEVSFICQCY